MSAPAPNPFADYLTMREVTRLLGASYGAAYSLAASGSLGEPIKIGRALLYLRSVAEPAIQRRRAEIRTRSRAGELATAHSVVA